MDFTNVSKFIKLQKLWQFHYFSICSFWNLDLTKNSDLFKMPFQVKRKHFLITLELKWGATFRRSLSLPSMLPHAELGPNDHQEDAPHFTTEITVWSYQVYSHQWDTLVIFSHPPVPLFIEIFVYIRKKWKAGNTAPR